MWMHSEPVPQVSAGPGGREPSFPAQTTGPWMLSTINGMTCLLASMRYLLKGLIQIADDIVDVFDTHAEANHLWRYSGFLLLLRRQLPVGRGRRVTCQRL